MVLDKKATTAYVKAKEQLLLKNGLLYRKTYIGLPRRPSFSLWCLKDTAVQQWTVATTRRHTKAMPLRLSDAGAILVARYGPGPP